MQTQTRSSGQGLFDEFGNAIHQKMYQIEKINIYINYKHLYIFFK